MQLIELTEEQPKHIGFYFVIGKHGYKSVLWWNGQEFEFDGNTPVNKFCKEYCKWIKFIN